MWTWKQALAFLVVWMIAFGPWIYFMIFRSI